MSAQEQKKMVFADACSVPLKDGRYCVSMEQDTELWDTLKSEKLYFKVEGPRFDLGNEGVHSFYPPEGVSGGYGKVLPHIVLNRRTLPWERALSDISQEDAGDMQMPWICLLVLHEDEILPVQSGIVKDVAVSGNNNEVYIPELKFDSNEEEEVCRFLDIPKDLFLRIAPRVAELPWLCHAGNAENDRFTATVNHVGANDGDGWHSVVMANRFPVSSEEGAKNHVYLVSMEGYENYESELPQKAQSCLRLFVLQDWEFYSVTEAYRFGDVIKDLKAGPFIYPPDGVSGELAPILQNGYAPLTHTLRNGESTVSFYRSCCVPKPLDQMELEADTADSLYAYDPELGVLDISYAAAWQAGRLAVLNRRSIAEKIMEQRRKNIHAVRRMAHLEMLRENLPELGMNGEEKLGTELVSFLEELGGRLS